MVTNWELHWDKLGAKWNHSTLFTVPVIKDNLANTTWPTEATTLFIKKTKENSFEKAWLGKTKNFRKDSNNGKPAIRFEVTDLVEIDCPIEYRNYTNGWHLNKSFVQGENIQFAAVIDNGLTPAFFEQMSNCSWELFEQHCFHLLRVIGIHDIHTLPRQAQQGKADGFFRFHSLTVIYDATLENNFESVKEQQIENYINQLKKEKIDFNKISYTIKNTQRQVWIITRGNSVRLLKTEDHVKVKEVPYTKLIDVYNKRLKAEIGSDELWDILKDLK